ncbi:hypothetical protein KRX19_02500 [Cardiobacteriaceae bacterium TAE3-ERU3]|nr:hypothetical protein [Cardiobacteriaceae bacterium TAE3-ERU3]
MAKNKRHAILAALLSLLCSSVLAQGLSPDDTGDYVLLHSKTQKPTTTFMRLFLEGEQWMLDGKRGDEGWQPVCRAEGNCRLRDSSSADIATLFAKAPDDMCKEYDITCIQNIAQAICRLDGKNGDDKIYLMFALVTGKPIPIELRKVR